MNVQRILAFFAAASILGACSGGTRSAFVPATPGGPSADDRASAPESHAAKHGAKLELTLEIPRRSKRSHYISRSTQSIQIKERGTTLGTFDTTPTSKGCVGSGASTVCRFNTLAAPGNNEPISVATYDGGNAGGNVLSEATVVKTIAANKANTIALTLDGVPASLALHLSNANPTQGSTATLTLTVTVKDADGNTIIGPGTYARAISLVNSAPSVATLSASRVTSPSANVVTVHYTGAVGNATFTASATGVTNATATLVSVKPHSSFVGGVWAAIPAASGISYYSGSASPSFLLSGGGMTAATIVTTDDAGGVIAGDASGRIERWPINAKNSATPTQSLTGAGNVTALAWDAKHQRIIYAAQGASSFCVVSANASGAVSGSQTCYTSTYYPIASTVSGLAVDPNTGNLYVGNATPVTGAVSSGGYCPQSTGGHSCTDVLVFTLAGSGAYNLDHTLDIESCHSGNDWAQGQLAFDPSVTNSDYSAGALWYVNQTDNDVIGIASSSSGCSINDAGEFSGDGTDLVTPQGIAWDGGSGLWVSDASTTWLQHWTNVYSDPSVPAGSSYYLGPADGGKSPTSIAVFSVSAGH